jgi:hypothetical protein
MLNDKSLKSVADAVGKIMAEALKGDQHKIDKNKNNKIDAHDFKLLRKEGWDDMVKSAKDAVKSGPKPNGGAGVKQGTAYGGGKQKDEKPVKEEASQAEFTAELKKAQAKAAGTTKQADVAKPAVQAVQQEETELQEKRGLWDNIHAKRKRIEAGSGERMRKPGSEGAPTEKALKQAQESVELEERSLTSDEKEKMEKNVKGMKKNLSGFKERYGKDAKSVMYATATKIAKKD